MLFIRKKRSPKILNIIDKSFYKEEREEVYVRLEIAYSMYMLLLALTPITAFSFVNQVDDSILIANEHNLTLSGVNIFKGNITIVNSSNIVIENNNILNSFYFGIFIYNSTNITISNNIIKNSYYDGISIRNSKYVEIKYNIITNNTNGNGISVWDDSKYININNNKLLYNLYGIFVLSSSNVSIFNNSLSNIYHYGVYLYNSSLTKVPNNSIRNSDVGIEIIMGNLISIQSNAILNNLVGIYIGENIGNLSIIGNLIQDSKYFGVLIYNYPTTFTFKTNTFMNNVLNVFYAYNTTIPKISVSNSTILTTIKQSDSHFAKFPSIISLLLLIMITVFLVYLFLLRRGRR